MFKNKALKVTVIEDTPSTSTHDVTVGDNVDAISEMIAKNTKPVALAVVAVVVAKTLSEIAVHASKTYIK